MIIGGVFVAALVVTVVGKEGDNSGQIRGGGRKLVVKSSSKVEEVDGRMLVVDRRGGWRWSPYSFLFQHIQR